MDASEYRGHSRASTRRTLQFSLAIQGATQFKLKKFTEALECLNTAYVLKQDDELTGRYLAATQFELHNYERALEIFSKINVRPNDAFLLTYRGATQFKLQNHNEALKDLSKANELMPNKAFTLAYQGAVQFHLEKYEEALEHLIEANKLRPKYSFQLAYCGATHLKLHNYKEALMDLDKANELCPDDYFTLSHQGVAQFELEKFDEALKTLNLADALFPVHAKAYTIAYRGATQFMLRDYKNALEDFNRAIELGSIYEFTLKFRGATHFELLNYDDALEDLDCANRLCPNDAFTLAYKGALYYRLQCYSMALDDLNKANELRRCDPFTLTHRGATLFQLRKYRDAYKDLDGAHELCPDDAVTLVYRGASQWWLQNYEDALKDLKRASELGLDNELLPRYLGATQFVLENYKVALEDLIKANELCPNNGFILLHLGATRHELGNFEAALDDLVCATELCQDDSRAMFYRAATHCALNHLEELNDDLIKVKYLCYDDSYVCDVLDILLSRINHCAMNDMADNLPSHDTRCIVQCGEQKQLLSNDYYISEYLSVVQHKLYHRKEPMTSTSKRKKKHKPLSQDSCFKFYSFEELELATTSFHANKVLGQGGFGVVYKGILSSGVEVAVKVLQTNDSEEASTNSKNVILENSFEAEVKTLGHTNHINVVNLLGYCKKDKCCILVYEFVSNGSLDKWLFREKCDHLLTWEVWFDIALGIARGLAYLHDVCIPARVHLDIKPQNIMMDASLCPKVGDFGLAKLMHPDYSQMMWSKPQGTLGYCAPEIMAFGEVSVKADVYSFGMLLMVFMSGKHLFDYSQINEDERWFPSWLCQKARQGKWEDIFKRLNLGNNDTKKQRCMPCNYEQTKMLIKLALACSEDDRYKRPKMSGVVQALEEIGERCYQSSSSSSISSKLLTFFKR